LYLLIHNSIVNGTFMRIFSICKITIILVIITRFEIFLVFKIGNIKNFIKLIIYIYKVLISNNNNNNNNIRRRIVV